MSNIYGFDVILMLNNWLNQPHNHYPIEKSEPIIFNFRDSN